jgi:hypothetical protein
MIGTRRHLEALREGDMHFQAERDRRYAEVKQEQEKAIKIKETADLAALELAREIQTYKDEKANELRSQIESERGSYLTTETYQARHGELEKSLAALAQTVTALVTERSAALRDVGNRITIGLGVATIIIAAVVGLANHII